MPNALGLAVWLALVIAYVATVVRMSRETGRAAKADDAALPPRGPTSIDVRAARRRRDVDVALLEPPPLALAPQRRRVDAEAGGGLLERRRLG